MPEIELTVEHEVGLHARPAALFVRMASTFASEITVANLSTGAAPVNAKSILSLLTSGVEYGHRIRITAQGADEDAALQALRRLVESNFNEKSAP